VANGRASVLLFSGHCELRASRIRHPYNLHGIWRKADRDSAGGGTIGMLSKNIFIVGDLYIDHDIFVRDLPWKEDSGNSGEHYFEVVRRQDTAGGAANSARILSVLNDGETFLWGIVGISHWGTFRQVLANSLAIDGAPRAIELRGVSDETGAPMNTTTRLLMVGAGGSIVEKRYARFYDVGHAHVVDAKRESVLSHLERIQEDKNKLGAIVINDFGRKALTKSLLRKISNFAAAASPPIPQGPRITGCPK
jgi:bifunctional ADP-heptose synthase (sugar kinase/adenylyltransferase)